MSRIIRIVLIVLSTLILIVGVGSYVGYEHLMNELVPVEGDQVITVEIPKGSSIRQAASILEEQKLLKNAMYFTYYVRWKYPEVQFMAGNYRIAQGSTIDQILQTLGSGDVIRDTVRFTIPEGYSVEQIAQKLADEGLVNQQEFLEHAARRDYDYWFIDEIPDNDLVKYPLEGFLFPETYEVAKEATEHEIINKMLKQFEREFLDEWRLLSEQSGMSVYEIVIMASIVEREAIVDEERSVIAGVFYNRLLSNPAWKLESCATIQYALGKQKSVITYEDLEIESPFNTYKHEGMPPTPIANPGRESLKAAVSPGEHDYYFFVTKKNGSNEHHFSRTYDEHKQNDAKSRGSW